MKQPQRFIKQIYQALIFYIIFQALAIYGWFLVSQQVLTPNTFILFIILSFNAFAYVFFSWIYKLKKFNFQQGLHLTKYQYLEDEIKTYAKHRHDTKNHLIILHELATKEDLNGLKSYASQYAKKLDQSLITIHTGLEELDILLYAKLEQANTNDVSVEFRVVQPLHVHKKHVLSVISIISNLIDNALEAIYEIQDTENRTLAIHFDADPLDYIITVTNSFALSNRPNLEAIFDEGYSTKNIKKERGKGLTIVRNLVNKYNGQITVDLFNDLFFQVRIEIPKHQL